MTITIMYNKFSDYQHYIFFLSIYMLLIALYEDGSYLLENSCLHASQFFPYNIEKSIIIILYVAGPLEAFR